MKLLSLFVSCCILSLVTQITFAEGFQTENQRKLSMELTKAVNQINQSAPKALDEETRLDGAATTANYIIYNNTLVNLTVEELDVNEVDKILYDAVIKPLCSNDGLKSFKKFGVIMVYRYLDKNGKFVAELSKDMSTCS